jgi:Bacterial regulatory proteins, luxR family
VGRGPAARGDLLAGHPDPERFVAEFSGTERTVAEYLLAEMLDRQPPGVQDLLLRTSLLDRVSGELADLLTGRPDSVALMNLGTAEAWALGLPDAERHLREGAALAREIGRPYLEVACLAQLGFASLGLHSVATIQRRCREAAERALALAEPDRLILPFAMTGSAGLLEALPRHQTAHAALLADILDVLHGASPAAKEQSSPPPAEELSPGELRYLPTNLSRPEIAGQLSVSPNTVNAHIRSIYAKLGVRDRSAAVQRARDLRLLAAAGRTR